MRDGLRKLRRVVRGERGAAYFEYALLVSLIAVVCIAAISFFGHGVEDSYSGTISHVANID